MSWRSLSDDILFQCDVAYRATSSILSLARSRKLFRELQNESWILAGFFQIRAGAANTVTSPEETLWSTDASASFYNMLMSDEEYLELSEVSFLLRDLSSQMAANKNEDPSTVAKNYFQNVMSGNHVIGTDYSYVVESNYNRKSLVYCLIKAFKNFPDNTELTAVEFYMLIESVVTNFPKSIIMEALLSIENTQPSSPHSSSSKFLFRDIAVAVYTQILYDEWLKLMEEFFREENTLNFVSLYRIKGHVEDLNASFSSSIFQPSTTAVSTALEVTSAATSPDGDMTYDQFRKCLFTSRAISYELYAAVSVVGCAPSVVRPSTAAPGL